MAKDPENEARKRALDRIRRTRSGMDVDPPSWAEAIAAGDRSVLARAISMVESRRAEDRTKVSQLLSALPAPKTPTMRYGITGVPGVGKSTWIEAAGMALIQQGHKVAVLAVDPSSQRTGGSMLGDKTRMNALSHEPNAYVRPSPAGDALGGVGRATAETTRLCEAAGFNRILIETVGVGQSETEVRNMTDVFLLLMLPGGGDGVQGIKRGILEWADLVLMNKADGPKEQRQRAEEALSAYRGAMTLMQPPAQGDSPILGTTSGLDEADVAQWVSRIEDRLARALESGLWSERRLVQYRSALELQLNRDILSAAKEKPEFEAAWARLQTELERTQIPPYDAIRRLLKDLL